MKIIKIYTMPILATVLALGGCATRVLEYENSGELQKNEEFEQVLQVKQLPDEATAAAETEVSKDERPTPEIREAKPVKPKATQAKKEQKKKKEKPKVKKQKEAVVAEVDKSKESTKPVQKKPEEKSEEKKTAKREPSLEDAEGFVGRRPEVDPFRIGEKVTLSLTYFNVSAGDMTLETRPFVEVNGKKSYHFVVTIKSSKVFSYFYSVNDVAETYVDYETLLPHSHSIHVKESKQLKEIRSFYDWENLKGKFWEKKVSKDDGEKEKRKAWDIQPYAQNVISSVFYLRTFQLKPKKELAFRVADAGDNLVFTGKVLRREQLKTDVGTFNTVVVKPKITLNGVFKPMGDIYFWLTDDDRKMIVRIESKIKIGTIIGKLKSIKP